MDDRIHTPISEVFETDRQEPSESAKALLCLEALTEVRKAAGKKRELSTKFKDKKFTLSSDAKGACFTENAIGKWDSKDGGRTWIRRDSKGHHVWRGTVGIEGTNYIMKGSDYGLDTTWKGAKGSILRSMTDASGRKFAVETNAKGVATYRKDKDGEWDSTDGKKWVNKKTKAIERGTALINDYGQYEFRPEKGAVEVHRSKKLEQIMAKERELERDFDVKFAKPGETKLVFKKLRVTAGVPTSDELDLLKTMLYRTRYADHKGLKFWYTIEPHDSGEILGNYRYKSKFGGPELTLLPSARVETKGWHGQPGVLSHELMHHAGVELWQGVGLGKPARNDKTNQIIEELGWQYSAKEHCYLLRDKEGRLWKRVPDKDKKKKTDPKRWHLFKGDRPKDGKIELTTKEMHDRAEVTPPTGYFPNPNEEFAELKAKYLTDRAALAKESPALYKLCKRLDQEALDEKFGPGEAIRAPNGDIVRDFIENRERVKKKEKEWGIKWN
jgi:hypothetical protein